MVIMMTTINDLLENLKGLLDKFYLRKQSSDYTASGVVVTDANKNITTQQSISANSTLISGLSTVAKDGNYSSLNGKPTKLSDFNDDLGSTYLKLTGGTLTGAVSSNSNFTTTGTISGGSVKITNGTASQFLKANGTVDTNTYIHSVGTNLTKTNSTITHSASGVTAGTNYSTNQTPSFDSTFHIPRLTFDAQGHITASTTSTVKIPSLPTASTSNSGIVQLNDNVNSTSTTQGATANAVKKTYDEFSSNTKTTKNAHTHSSNDVTGLTASKSVCTNSNGVLATEDKNNHSHSTWTRIDLGEDHMFLKVNTALRLCKFDCSREILSANANTDYTYRENIIPSTYRPKSYTRVGVGHRNGGTIWVQTDGTVKMRFTSAISSTVRIYFSPIIWEY